MSDGALEDSAAPLLRMVDEAALTPAVRQARLRKLLAQTGNAVLSVAIFTLAVTGLIVPPILFLVSGLWSTITYITGVWTLWHEVEAWRINDMFTALVAVDASSRFALAGVSYFTLIFSFIVLFAGLLGRRWQHMFVVPGVILCAPSIVIFTVAATLSFSVLAQRLYLPGWLQYPLIGYALVDALLLAALLLDLRPSAHRRKRTERRGHHTASSEAATVSTPTPLPLVRFGPSQPLSGADARNTLSQLGAVVATSSAGFDSADEVKPSVVSVQDDGAATMPGEIQVEPALGTEAGVPATAETVVTGNAAP
jgi:hypothetical protein